MSQTTLAPELRRAPSDAAETAPLQWKDLQLKWMLFQFIGLFVLGGGLFLFRCGPTGALFTHADGLRMVGQALCWLLAGNSVGYVICYLLDRTCPAWSQDHRAICQALFGLWGAVQLYLFTLPAVYVLVIGPSVLNIVRNLLAQ